MTMKVHNVRNQYKETINPHSGANDTHIYACSANRITTCTLIVAVVGLADQCRNAMLYYKNHMHTILQYIL